MNNAQQQKPTSVTKPSMAVAGAESFTAAVEFIFFGSNQKQRGEDQQVPPRWGVMPQTGDIEAFCRNWIKLIGGGCREFVQVCLPQKTENYPAEIKEHRFLRPFLQHLKTAASLQTLAGLLASVEQSGTAVPTASIRLYLEAVLLQCKIRHFSHGQAEDIVNSFLAPARLLIQSGANIDQHKAHWNAVWSGFQRRILNDEELSSLSLGQELNIACKPINEWIANGSQLEHGAVEGLMLLLTQVRTLADHKSKRDGRQPSKKLVKSVEASPKNNTRDYRILVADDHAEAWRPLFETLAANVAGTLDGSVRFDFSLDGKELSSAATPAIPICYGAYDLVVLDVFLGNEDGREILKSIRRDFSQLPVLLWTTSRDEEIVSAARLANGIVLKKTVGLNELEEALSFWSQRGKAMRTRTLPNPFFNHTIQTLELRELAVRCHEWCLKQLDSFHALDNEYFRYFTDHGGRHIVKLLELLEQGLQPFLHDDERLLPTKKGDEHQREIEILGIYLAVVCHELGMFPMRVGSTVEDFSTLGRAYLNDVRSLHAVRGMVLLHDRKGGFWNDGAGKELGGQLHKFDGLAERLAVLVGYHARVFKSLKNGAFLTWEQSSPDLHAKLKELSSPVPSLSRTDEAFRATFTALSERFPDPAADGAARERLRCQCALFRFIDALDVTFTRNPAEFLIGTRKLPPKQYGENLKRELCRKAQIDSGVVQVEMIAGREPKPKDVKAIIGYMATELSPKKPEELLQAQAAQTLANDPKKLGAIVKTPWQPPNGSQAWCDEGIGQSAACLQKSLDRWLAEVWTTLITGQGSTGFISHLKGLGILHRKTHEPRLLFAGAQTIASIAGLSVAGELLDEYRALVDANLTDKIQLSRVGWKWGEPWKSNEIPADVSTLRRVLPDPAE